MTRRLHSLVCLAELDFNSMHGDPRDRVLGTLVGLAAGDKNHGPSEMAWRLASSLVALGSPPSPDLSNLSGRGAY